MQYAMRSEARGQSNPQRGLYMCSAFPTCIPAAEIGSHQTHNAQYVMGRALVQTAVEQARVPWAKTSYIVYLGALMHRLALGSSERGNMGVTERI